MLGGFVHVEIPLNLTAMIEALSYTCQMVHLVAHNGHLSASGIVFLRHTLMAMEDNCKSEEISRRIPEVCFSQELGLPIS